jgi:hypothetical protein
LKIEFNVETRKYDIDFEDLEVTCVGDFCTVYGISGIFNAELIGVIKYGRFSHCSPEDLPHKDIIPSGDTAPIVSRFDILDI